MTVETVEPVGLAGAIMIADVAKWNATDEKESINAVKVAALMHGYHRRWAGQPWKTISLESTVQCPIINPESGRASRKFTQAGKHDGIIEGCASGGDMRLLLEHKTTSSDITDPDATYWRRLDIDSQISMYQLQQWQGSQKLDLNGTMYDVIRKPTTRPRKLTAKELKTLIEDGEYFGEKISHESAVEITDRENAELYFIRLRQDTYSSPDRYFQRKIIVRLDSEILEFAGELWDVTKTIGDAIKNDRHYRNSDACMNYGVACQYLGVCSGKDDIDSDNWEKKPDVHVELDSRFGDGGRGVLTNSRIKCFQNCRRKHYYDYILGKRRVAEDKSEALWIGTLMHEALEAWWKDFR
jgi:hypothetical protein